MLATLAVIASLHAVDVPATFGDKVDTASVKSGLPVLIPQTIPSKFTPLYPSVQAGKGSYELDLGAAEGCNGATACGVAYFGALKGQKPIGKVTVELAHGITGKFTPTQCGGSCAPPQVQWRQHGAVYFVEVKGPVREKRANVRAANSAIRHGGRYDD